VSGRVRTVPDLLLDALMRPARRDPLVFTAADLEYARELGLVTPVPADAAAFEGVNIIASEGVPENTALLVSGKNAMRVTFDPPHSLDEAERP
jgi:hypothetical protein